MSALPPKADIAWHHWHVRLVPIATERSAAKNRYSITSSARPGKWRRNGDAERFGGLEIDVKLDFGYLPDR
jgi:hypothetical protein